MEHLPLDLNIYVYTCTQTEEFINKERKKRRKECYCISFATREYFDAKNTTQRNFYWASTPLSQVKTLMFNFQSLLLSINLPPLHKDQEMTLLTYSTYIT